MITIYKKGTKEVRTIIKPDDSSKQDRGIMRNDILSIGYSKPLHVQLSIGDYADLFGSRYQVNNPVPFKQTATRNIQYTLTLEGWQYDLKKTNYLFLDANNRFTEGKFNMRARAIDFMNLIIYNLKRRDRASDWVLGDVDASDYVEIEFDSQNCLEVLSTLASQFKTEYLFEGKKISLVKRQVSSGITLQLGQEQALTSIAMENQDNGDSTGIITRLFAYGSDRNIGTDYRDGAKYLRMADSLYIERNADVFGIFEKFIYFDDIYPRREGTITAVTSALVFTDTSIDFNVNLQLLPGVTAQVTFNTGLLTGYTFDIKEDGFDYDTKTFTINAQTNQTVNLPTDDLKPAIGDKYVLTGIKMPISYIVNAEAELKARAITYIRENGPGKVVYPVDCNNVFFKKSGIELELGKTYRLLSPEFNIDKEIRLISYTRNINSPEIYTVELADSVAVQSTFVKLINLL